MRFLLRKPWMIVLLVALVIGGLITTASLLHVRRTSRTIISAAKVEAQEAAVSFADATSAWILSEADRGYILDRVFDIMIGSDTLYIQVQRQGTSLIDVRAPGLEGRIPSRSDAINHTLLQTLDHRLVLDSLVAFPGGDASQGTLRIGSEATELAIRLRDIRLAVALVSLIAWTLLVSSTLAFLRLRHARTFRLIEHAPVEESDEQVFLADHPLTINSRAKSIVYLDREVSLAPKPFLLLELLAREHGRVFTDGEIIEHVWTDSTYVNSNDVRQCVYRLRCQLNEIEDGLGGCVTNVKGFGYRFDVDKLVVEEISS